MEESKSSPSSSPSSSKTKRNINSYYGHKVGFWQSLSLILNAGLMVYAHIGLSGVIFTNQDPSAASGGSSDTPVIINGTGVCTANDISIWNELGGEAMRPIHSTFCSREFTQEDTGGALCLSNPACIATCFQAQYNYSEDCSKCLGSIPQCAVGDGCLLVCAGDSLGQECQDCNADCIAQMFVCSGLPQETNGTTTTADATATATANTLGVRRFLNDNTTTTNDDDDVCNDWDLNNVPIWYRVYDLTFVGSVNDAWNGDAQLLAVIVVFFSGFWPYAKNVILLIVWYLPMTIEWQTWSILWLSRLSKYTLVDVFAVVVVLVGVQLQLNVGGTEAIIRAEPRFGILAFFVATLWEFIQIEVIKAMHEDKVLNLHKHANDGNDATNKENTKETANPETTASTTATTTDAPAIPAPTPTSPTTVRLYFDDRLEICAVLWGLSVGLFAAGAVTEIVQFTSKDLTATEGCTTSYNLVTLANAMVNELGLLDNSVAWQTWVLYIVYLLLNLAFPILVHLMQLWSMVNWKKWYQQKGQEQQQQDKQLLGNLQKVSLWTSAIWCFACIEILLIGIFAVEFKFSDLVARLAGDSNAVFLDITSGLGAGFYILLAYSFIAGFLQFTLRVIHDDPIMPSSCNDADDDADAEEGAVSSIQEKDTSDDV
ncbi:unnamed protein product [Cylindrotheca closterium]|uniref:Uncharacterized protein n=1 Tax=Cylindrotheca closterium TaxID=2856 RepID=A0AAD2JHR1_9STRA|nr:unnamed protein product [Cylindrotheca closterium]